MEYNQKCLLFWRDFQCCEDVLQVLPRSSLCMIQIFQTETDKSLKDCTNMIRGRCYTQKRFIALLHRTFGEFWEIDHSLAHDWVSWLKDINFSPDVHETQCSIVSKRNQERRSQTELFSWPSPKHSNDRTSHEPRWWQFLKSLIKGIKYTKVTASLYNLKWDCLSLNWVDSTPPMML